MRIALANDVAVAVEALRRVILQSGEHSIAWVAWNGVEAVELCAHNVPDVLLMDLFMPRMDGVEATRRIMAATPCPIVVVTADMAGNSAKVFEAMGAGALDAVNTPVLGGTSSEKGAAALLAKVETVRRLLGLGRSAGIQRIEDERAEPLDRARTLVAIGASAGGPSALARILAGFGPDFPAAVVGVQHLDSQFTQGLANWLDYQTALRVQLAQHGDEPRPGTVLLAGQNNHLVFTRPARLEYVSHPTHCAYRPSIDVFFRSALRFWEGEIIGVLLTGMGRDGAAGLQALRHHGCHTIAQDRSSSAVYGMPKAAADLDAASEILPLNDIAARIRRLLTQPIHIHA